MENVRVNFAEYLDLTLDDCKYVLNDYEDEMKELGVSLDDDGSSKWVKDKEGLLCRFMTTFFTGLELSLKYNEPPKKKMLGRNEDTGELLDIVYGNVERFSELDLEKHGVVLTDEQRLGIVLTGELVGGAR